MNLFQFILVGINYKKTEASTRGLFAINNQENSSLLKAAKKEGIEQLFVLSTCNRTEVYAVCDSIEKVFKILATHTKGGIALLKEKAYCKYSEEAIQHLFEVAAGIDSQILGDYEIIGQLKNSFKIAKQEKVVGAFLERLFNTVLQSSKAIKNNTNLSSGTTSISFAAIQYILDHITEPSSKIFIVIGTGKIGINTCKNIKDYINPKELWASNRTEEKAVSLANELNITVQPFEHMNENIQKADVVIVATNSADYIIKKENVFSDKSRCFIDLSIPNNIDVSISTISQQTLINIDDLSKINDQTLSLRKSNIPKALEIIAMHVNEFNEWHRLRKFAPVLKLLKTSLDTLNLQSTKASQSNSKEVNFIVNKVATELRTKQQPSCFYMQAVQDFIKQPNFN
ncbi:glutamyl-tRNA reductase [Sediminibacterium sp.]|uniref:glutamyl-tRNA reductase n=1 Tax=Sediminibacterium sp. TaxID=1917865 RepID=UPI002737148F|nr:glutamyl-tRNA reductase [Sediminibacterium sp.]MDP3392966.1 glutamyl-tRNA reductase [Sediminibacterium sp.]MDP3567172.1 glutamyl-tRNA reductase [Sediminibacterium sp.]